MGVKFSELPILPSDELTSDDYLAVLDTSEGILKRTTPEIPVPVTKGGTGNQEGYVRAGRLVSTTIGPKSTAEGTATTSSGTASHAEGAATSAINDSAHAEGSNTTAAGIASHAEGTNTIARGDYSHAEGNKTEAHGLAAHSSGNQTIAGYDYQTVIGKFNNNQSSTLFEIGNGTSNTARSNAFEVMSSGDVSVKKDLSVAGNASISGTTTTNNLTVSNNMSINNDLTVNNLTVNNNLNVSGGQVTSVVANPSSSASSTLTKLKVGSTTYGIDSGGLPEVPLSIANGGTGNTAGYIRTGQKSGTPAGTGATAEGNNTAATGDYSHAEGSSSTATGDYSHAEGVAGIASERGCHVEGGSTKASNKYAHAEGYLSVASEQYSHAEGYNTKAANTCAHAEGYNTKASGLYSHAEGENTEAAGRGSHASGAWTVADNYSYAGGEQVKLYGGSHNFVVGNSITIEDEVGYIFANGDEASTKFSHLITPGFIGGARFSSRLHSVQCVKDGVYSARHGFVGTTNPETFRQANEYFYLSDFENGAIYLIIASCYSTSQFTRLGLPEGGIAYILFPSFDVINHAHFEGSRSLLELGNTGANTYPNISVDSQDNTRLSISAGNVSVCNVQVVVYRLS